MGKMKKKEDLLKKINSIDLSVQINKNLTLYYTDFFTLKPEHYLTDKIMNAFSSKLQTKFKTYYFFETMFMYDLEEGEKEKYKEKKSWHNQLTDYEILFIPILNYKKTHWVLIVVNMVSQKIIYYDSALTKKNKSAEKYLGLTKDFLSKVFPNIFFQTMTDEKTPQQTNNYDCGVYVCAIMECLCEKKELLFSPNDITDMRYRMMELFLEK
jgi:sentrin-specific protease 1